MKPNYVAFTPIGILTLFVAGMVLGSFLASKPLGGAPSFLHGVSMILLLAGASIDARLACVIWSPIVPPAEVGGE